MSTSVLKGLPGKLDIKRHLPSILYLSKPVHNTKSTLKYLLFFTRKLYDYISVKSCTNFTVENGVVNITSLEYIGEAHVTCYTGTWADNGQQNITVKCGANKRWEPTPTCSG